MIRKNGFRIASLSTALALTSLCTAVALAQSSTTPTATAQATPARPSPISGPPLTKKPNILLVIMDDVGIDQMSSFGYGGAVPGQTSPGNIPPLMPNIDAIAHAGVRFRNTWSMPECSPGRSVLFTGRLPIRNNIFQAIGANDLNNSQVATWEVTAPKLLQQANYTSGLFGKFHLGGPDNNPFKNGAPASLGWDFFYGWTGGLPGSIDTTAGGVGAAIALPGTYPCGFVPIAGDPGGTNSGACYIPADNTVSCHALNGTNPAGDSVGLQCLTRGGILVPNAACQQTPPTAVSESINNQDSRNAHYLSPLVINRGDFVEQVPLNDARDRGFRATIEVDAAVKWIKEQSGTGHPWMATVSFSADHTPLQPPPGKLLSVETRRTVQQLLANGGACTTTGLYNVNSELFSNALIEGMDSEFGRLLVEVGLAHFNPDGRTITYNPEGSNTILIILGDNGSLASTVKVPFDSGRAKATAYQTGVWVPLIVAGPMVRRPNRDVNSMVNIADVFSLFGEVAGIDVHQAVPRILDARPLAPYLTNPNQASIRDFDITEGGFNLQANGGHNGPCVVPFPEGVTPPAPFTESVGLCSQVPVSQSVCTDNFGVWWGPGADPAQTFPGFTGVNECWEVNQALYQHLNDSSEYVKQQALMLPGTYTAIRNDHFKIVKNYTQNYDPNTNQPADINSIEFYEINEDPPATLKLDLSTANLLPPCTDIDHCDTHLLTKIQRESWISLKLRLAQFLATAPDCPGDGNGDSVVNRRDLLNWALIANTWGESSQYDFNLDGLTNSEDKAIIQQNLGRRCPNGN